MGKHGHTAMPLIILLWKNWRAEEHRIHENGAQNFIFLAQNSDNPSSKLSVLPGLVNRHQLSWVYVHLFSS